MPASLVRQWLILSLLPRPPHKVDAATLERRLRERGHEVHRRTIQRDLVELASVFPIVADDRNKPYGWRWSHEALGAPLPVSPPSAEGPARALDLELRAPTALVPSLVARLSLHVLARVEEGATTLLTARAPESPRLVSLLFLFGGECEVRAPASLRRELAQRARRVLAKNG